MDAGSAVSGASLRIRLLRTPRQEPQAQKLGVTFLLALVHAECVGCPASVPLIEARVGLRFVRKCRGGVVREVANPHARRQEFAGP